MMREADSLELAYRAGYERGVADALALQALGAVSDEVFAVDPPAAERPPEAIRAHPRESSPLTTAGHPAVPQEAPTLKQRIDEALERLPRVTPSTMTGEERYNANGEWVSLFDAQISIEGVFNRGLPIGHPPAEEPAQGESPPTVDAKLAGQKRQVIG